MPLSPRKLPAPGRLAGKQGAPTGGGAGATAATAAAAGQGAVTPEKRAVTGIVAASCRRCNQALTVAVLLLLPGCARFIAPEPALPQRQMPATFTALPEATTTVELPQQWWLLFDDAELNQLMTQAFANNLTLAQAWMRLRQAQAQNLKTQADQQLRLNADSSVRTSRNYATSSAARQNSGSTTLFGINLVAGYTLDLWGRLHAESSAAARQQGAVAADLQSTALLLSALVAQTWIDLRASRSSLQLLQAQAATSRQLLELLELRQRNGLSSAADVSQQQQNVAGTEALLPPAKKAVALLENRLALLLAEVPGAPTMTDIGLAALPEPPPLPASGVPAELLVNRPDIAAAWMRLIASHWEVGVARAERLPNLQLTAAAAVSSTTLTHLFDSWLGSLAANIAAPIIDGGRRRAEVQRRQAIAQQLLFAYRDRVLSAIGEVEDALVRNYYDELYLAGLQTELQYSHATLAQTQRRYQSGITDYLPVLTALTSIQRLERNMITAHAAVLKARVGLCEALGGDWMQELELEQEQ